MRWNDPVALFLSVLNLERDWYLGSYKVQKGECTRLKPHKHLIRDSWKSSLCFD